MVLNTAPLRPTHARIDLDALAYNLDQIRAHVEGRPVMGIVKANAYGHGLVPTALAMQDMGIDALGVAFLEEGVALREAGVRCPVLVLGGIIGNQVDAFIEQRLDITASSVFKLQQIDDAARRLGRRARVHLKIDTGMGRIGTQWDTADALVDAALDADHCEVVGVFSHLSSSESVDPTATRRQEARFAGVVEGFVRRGRTPPVRHLANSGAVLQHPSTWLDLVRPGLSLYGVVPAPHLQGVLPLRPVLSLHTRVVFFKVQRRGRPVSYDETWAPAHDTRVVTLPVGYGDGYGRRLSNRALVGLRGRRHPVVGRVTMDAVMVDIGPDGTAYNGDPVLLLGRSGGVQVSVEEMAEWLDTIPYEVLTSINTRVPRQYVGGGITTTEAPP
jgi:alanine racemase